MPWTLCSRIQDRCKPGLFWYNFLVLQLSSLFLSEVWLPSVTVMCKLTIPYLRVEVRCGSARYIGHFLLVTYEYLFLQNRGCESHFQLRNLPEGLSRTKKNPLLQSRRIYLVMLLSSLQRITFFSRYFFTSRPATKLYATTYLFRETL